MYIVRAVPKRHFQEVFQQSNFNKYLYRSWIKRPELYLRIHIDIRYQEVLVTPDSLCLVGVDLHKQLLTTNDLVLWKLTETYVESQTPAKRFERWATKDDVLSKVSNNDLSKVHRGQPLSDNYNSKRSTAQNVLVELPGNRGIISRSSFAAYLNVKERKSELVQEETRLFKRLSGNEEPEVACYTLCADASFYVVWARCGQRRGCSSSRGAFIL